MKVTVFGIGKMGLPLAVTFASKGFEVTGVDVNEELVKKVDAGEACLPEEPEVDELLAKAVEDGALAATTDGASCKDSEIIIILVPTLISETGEGVKPDLSIVRAVAKTIGKSVSRDAIIVTECTMPPGETEALAPLIEKESGLKLNEGFYLAHCPERTSSGTAIRDITGRYPKVIGASHPEAAKKLREAYEKINSKGVITVSSVKAAEAVKVFEGVYRDVNIALANELAGVCERLGINAKEVFSTANTQPYSHIHRPGCGVGGHCIPYYPHFIMGEDTPLVALARRTNDAMPLRTVERLIEKGARSVLVLGLTFRGGVKEFRKSPGVEIVRLLKEKGINVFARDPMCSNEEIKEFGAEPKSGFKGLDAVIIAANHDEFKEIDWNSALQEMNGKTVFDGVGMLDPKTIEEAGGDYSAWGTKKE
jgi:UDP-N-acetyl-D-mannosaminuronic acid dehydrogenase